MKHRKQIAKESTPFDLTIISLDMNQLCVERLEPRLNLSTCNIPNVYGGHDPIYSFCTKPEGHVGMHCDEISCWSHSDPY